MESSVVGDVRKSMVAVSCKQAPFIHTLIQAFLTWMTGKPLPRQQPLLPSTSNLQLASAVSLLLAGISLGVLGTLPGFWVWLPVAWTLQVSGARRLQVQIFHHCVHQTFSGVAWIDRLLAEIISTMLLIAPFDKYVHDHIRRHHPVKYFGTEKDPDLAFLLALGFRPGLGRRQLWVKLILTMVSLRFHYLFLAGRLRANFVEAQGWRRLAAYIYAVSLLAIILYSGTWFAFALGVLLPLTLLYHISALLQFISEHRWFLVREEGESGKKFVGKMCVGRFTGSPYPLKGKWAKLVWLLKMSGHAFTRVFCLVNSVPDHDWHHRHPASVEWPNSMYARQSELDLGCAEWPESYSEVWGLIGAIDANFVLWSSLPSESVLSDSMDVAEAKAFATGM
jgi:fatty acid desaturase